MRYFKREWDESRGDQFDNWGTSLWFFEANERGEVLRQIQRYENGPVLTYERSHLNDKYGGLADQPLDLAEFLPFEIASTEFEGAWRLFEKQALNRK